MLLCNANLCKKLKIRNANIFNVCDKDETAIHLFYECKHVEDEWTRVGEALDINITQDSIVCRCMDGDFYRNNIVITLACFLIYKKIGLFIH